MTRTKVFYNHSFQRPASKNTPHKAKRSIRVSAAVGSPNIPCPLAPRHQDHRFPTRKTTREVTFTSASIKNTINHSCSLNVPQSTAASSVTTVTREDWHSSSDLLVATAETECSANKLRSNLGPAFLGWAGNRRESVPFGRRNSGTEHISLRPGPEGSVASWLDNNVNSRLIQRGPANQGGDGRKFLFEATRRAARRTGGGR